jgi:fatty acid desaturase
VERHHEHDWLTRAARAGKRYHFQAKTPWVHNLIGLSSLIVVVIVIFALLELSGSLTAGVYVPLAGVAFGFCYYSLLGIGVHEASHGMMILCAGAERRTFWNRVIGWICAVPFGAHYRRHWEEGHFTHHSRPIESDDPQAFNRQTGWRLGLLLFVLLFIPGSAFVHRFTTKRPSGMGGSSPAVLVGFVTLWGTVFSLVVHSYGWPAAVAMAYGLQVLAALNQLKGALEHGGDVAFDRNPLLRSRSVMLPLRILLPMFYVTIYHFEHHLNYTVPWYDLPRYHRDVRALAPQELHDEIFNADLFAQLAGRKGPIPARN